MDTPQPVYPPDSDDAKFIMHALKAGVPISRLEVTLAIAKMLDKPVQDVNNAWMDAHVGIQQVIRNLPQEVMG